MTFFQLVYYEWKKLFSFTFVRMIVALMLVLNIAMAIFYIHPLNAYNVNGEIETVYGLYQTDPDSFRAQYDTLIQKWYNGEEMPSAIYSNGKIADRSLFFTVECFARADADYHDQMDAFLAKTRAFHQTLTTASYNYRYQNAIIEKYEALNETVEIKNEPVYGWNEYFGYSAEVIFVLIAVFACAIVIGMDDTQTGFLSIRSASVRGGRSTVAAKFTAVTALCFALAIVFALSSLITVSVIYGLSDSGNAIQAVFFDVVHGKIGEESSKIDLMAFCPLPLTIAEFLAVFFLQKAMAAVLCGVVIFTATIFYKRYWLSAAIGGSFLFLQHIISGLDVITADQWKYLNVFSVFSAKDFLSRFRCVDLFGYPADLLHIFYALFLLIVGLSFLACMLFGGQHKRKHRHINGFKG